MGPEQAPSGEHGEAGEEKVGTRTWRWAGKGPEAAGNSHPSPGEASVGSPEAASRVLPLPNPRLLPYPHKLALGKRWGKMPNVKK